WPSGGLVRTGHQALEIALRVGGECLESYTEPGGPPPCRRHKSVAGECRAAPHQSRRRQHSRRQEMLPMCTLCVRLLWQSHSLFASYSRGIPVFARIVYLERRRRDVM